MDSRNGPPEWVKKLPDEKASKPNSWPPKSSHYFDWEHWETYEAYHDPEQSEYTPKFSLARSRLDYDYHRNPAYTRQELQDTILSRVTSATYVNGQSQQRRPWIVFTAGAMGVGKGYVLSTLHKSGLFPLDGFLKIDPDMLKAELPEMSGYLRTDAATAATKIHRESTQMADVLFEHALLNLISMVVDGSLRDVTYYRELFERIRSDHANYRIAILHVTAKKEAIHDRAKKRAERTGRTVPTELLDESMEQVPRSVKLLSPHTDVTFEISNEDDSPLCLVSSTVGGKSTSGGSWDDFASTWTEEEEETNKHPGDAAQVSNPCLLKRKKCVLRAVCDGGMASCWSNCNAHEAARAIWSQAYPNFCPRCTLSSDGQCGVCVHGKHLCACQECESICPVRQALRKTCKMHKTLIKSIGLSSK